MQCVFCQGQMREGQSFCPHCGRRQPTAPAQPAIQNQSVRQAQAMPQAQPAMPAQLAGQAKPTAQPAPASLPQTATPQVVAAGALAQRDAGQPPRQGKRALFLHFNEKPANIVAVMDQARRNQAEFVRQQAQRLRILALLMPAGLPFILAYYIFRRQNLKGLLLIAYVLWGAALVGLLVLRRNWPSEPGARRSASWVVGLFFPAFFIVPLLMIFGLWALLIGLLLLVPAVVMWVQLRRRRSVGEQFGPQFDMVRTAFETLKDDLAPGRTLLGWLDLTGPQQASKVVQQRTSPSGMPVALYRDEWLRLKMPLYDGNVLRFSVVERVKAKLGRWKRGQVSGKRKWKEGGTVWDRNELRIEMTVNPEAYEVLPIQRNQVGKFAVEAAPTSPGRVAFKAETGAPIGVEDILGVLRFAYEHLRPRGTGTVAGNR